MTTHNDNIAGRQKQNWSTVLYLPWLFVPEEEEDFEPEPRGMMEVK